MMKIKRPLVEHLIKANPETYERRKRTKSSKGYTCGISTITGVLQNFEREFKINPNDPILTNQMVKR
jgi:hypothetical protein